ncbi:MAG TPA: agmatine deiminase family protein [Humidesulfovibrio sp.]|uniref:agmatine deiminase family protein n=1 Tax=Humidesulfovibrio sp. TaxID=2910988 RepID=UPI002CB7AFD3|nr:agmatine deiminase family protein [Humidesulfovibrio sp.]HWR04936.1 agmatine deiminase family protein [Humidesulfovibrio sp.]
MSAAELRLPAEWEPHAATWITWPQNACDWPGKFAPMPWAFAEIIRKIANSEGHERARVLVADESVEKRARGQLKKAHVDMSRVDFFRIPTDRGWMRDCGPCFVEKDGKVAISGFDFDAWSKYPEYQLDALVPPTIAKLLDLEFLPAMFGERLVVFEGGAIDINGRGTLVTTEECCLDPSVQVRNPGFTHVDYEAVFASAMGAGNTIWLRNGIKGDDTHGHVDDFCRFTDARTLVLCEEKNPADENHAILEENREILEGAKLEDGTRPQVVRLPMPAPLWFDGLRLPASYANFLITNTAVLVPTFNDPNDRLALGILSECFSGKNGRPVIGIHAVDLVWGLGTIHCLTRQEPLGR